MTLLFTDIEGSTQLLQDLGERYGKLLRDHHQLILSAVEQHRGHLVDTQGDACFVVFATANAAVDGAGTAQQALAEHSWPGGVEVRVRMGLHTGSPVPMDERYVGMDVHRAARISAVAHGGQVIASSATVQLADPSRFEWIHLGQYRLKSLQRPEDLWQLRRPGLRADFPPPNARPWANDLPEPPTRFVGRKGDVEVLSKLLVSAESRLVTLVGPGGIGKTRLSVHVGQKMAERFADGIAFAPLATVTEAREVAPTIAAALGAPEGGGDPAHAVVERLQDAHLLLILDNLEHLPAASPLVADLVAKCRRLHVLATSRAPLNLYGERLHTMRPLSLTDDGTGDAAVARSDAVELFVDRARAVAPTFRLTSTNAGSVLDICRRLDGIPLALELAAARIAILSPEELLNRLTIEILTGGPTNVDERHRTLRATIDWSYRLLDEPSQELFRRLGIFAGGATLADAEPVVDPQSRRDVLAGIASLMAQSLIWRDEPVDGTSRFRMLETVRQFAAGELARAGELRDLSQLHADHFLAFMSHANEHIDGVDAGGWLLRINQEMANLRAALRWTLEDPEGSVKTGIQLADAMGWFWYTRGDAGEALRWLKLAAASTRDAPPATRVRLVYYVGAVLERLDRLEEAIAAFEEALAMCRELGDNQRVARTLNSLGGLAVEVGDTGRAFELLNEAERILRLQGDHYGRAVSLVNLCDAARASGEFDRAEKYGQSGHELFAELGDEWGVAVAMRHLAKVAYERGALSTARTRLLDALIGSHRVGDRSSAVRCLERLAGVEIAMDAPLLGTRLSSAAEKLRREIGEPLRDHRRRRFMASWDAARTALGDAEFEMAWTQGANMTADQAVDYALSARVPT